MLTIAPIPKELAMIEAKKYPTLTGNGFDYTKFTSRYLTSAELHSDRVSLWCDSGPLEIAYVIQFASENRISPTITSYGVKHLVERWSRERSNYKYICNGCAILGLSLAGYEVIVFDDSPNCFFRKRRRI